MNTNTTPTWPEDAVDPWAMQQLLMQISDQRMPPVPTLTVEGILYGALTMEEHGETLQALGDLMEATTNDGSPRIQALVSHIADLFNTRGQQLRAESKLIRNLMSSSVHKPGLDTLSFEPCAYAHAQHLMKALSDGITDSHVVLAGLELSLGIPGRQTYAAVWESNYSKRNPDTGRIDKDASGKWIKGSGYTPPNIFAILFPSA